MRLVGTAALAFFVAWLAGLTGRDVAAQEPPNPSPITYEPNIAPASDEGRRAIQGFRVADGLKVELFAAEPLLANPVSFSVDGRNRFFIAETYRYEAGVTDIRRHMEWVPDDLASRTVEDRVALYRKYLGKGVESYGIAHDRVRLVEDRDGDGTADHASVFADGFNEIAGGIGAGVLARGKDVWYTCIPDLWHLRDEDGDGKAEMRKSLGRGYGVHVGYIGHDMHGLRMGPDGKLYYSIGDRGLNVRSVEGKQVVNLESGSVIRCNPDGTELELFATGLRNPQELAFDEHGNLFTCDNNSDSGDKARWVHVVEGGDSGWRIGYQFLQVPVSRGPWNAEKLWDPAEARKAKYLVPPLANIADGPSGLTYDPGTGLPEKYRRHFFLCDFRGVSGQSGIRSFANQPDGASFRLVDSQEIIWGVLSPDLDFGTDGALYLCDWVERVTPATPFRKGRIYRITAPTHHDPEADKVKQILAEGMGGRSPEALVALLGHVDQRVRQEAQFALAARGAASADALAKVAQGDGPPLARLHAIWALGQVARGEPKVLAPVVALLNDGDAEARAQAARVLGDRRVGPAYEGLISSLRDPSPRVRFFAAMALGKLGCEEAVGSILGMLRENDDRDAYLRHAGVMGLAGIGAVETLRASAADPSAAVRTGVLLALRRLARPEVAQFLDDQDPAIVLEAARAINDVPIPAALPKLAAMAGRPGMADPLVRRVINANFRVGRPEDARALSALASRSEIPPAIRAEAIDALGEWASPPTLDRFTGLPMSLAERPAGEAVAALHPALLSLLEGTPEPVRQASARAAGRLMIREVGPALIRLAADGQRRSRTRVEALKAAEQLNAPGLADLAAKLADDRDGPLRTEALRVLVAIRPDEAVARLKTAIERGAVAERQGALKILGTVPGGAADALLSTWAGRMLEGRVPPEIRLDLIEACAHRDAPEVRRKLADYEARRPADDPLAPYSEALVGGNAPAGRKVFFDKAEVSCVRCHKVNGQGGEVGPDLSGIGAKYDRAYLLESIVAPGRKIAEGFESLIVATTDGQLHSGVLRSDRGDTLTLTTPQGKRISIPKADIDEQKRGESAMPDDVIKALTKVELRDLVEYLAGLKKPAVVGTKDDAVP